MFCSTSSELLVIKEVTPFLHEVSDVFRVKGRGFFLLFWEEAVCYLCKLEWKEALWAESTCAGPKRLLSTDCVRPEVALSHIGWDSGFLLAVLPVALLCKMGSISRIQQHKLVMRVPTERQVVKRTGCLSVPSEWENVEGDFPLLES